MRKLLSILASVGMVATASSAVVACGAIKKSVTWTPDVLTSADKYSKSINDIYNFQDKNNDIAAKVGKEDTTMAEDNANRVELEGNKNAQEDASDMLIMVTKYISAKDKADKEAADKAVADAQKKYDDDAAAKVDSGKLADDTTALQNAQTAAKKNYATFELGDPQDIREDISNTKDTATEVTIKFISATNIASILNNDTYNTYTKTVIDGQSSTSTKYTIVDKEKDTEVGTAAHSKIKPDSSDSNKKMNTEITVNDMVDIEKNSDKFTGSWNEAMTKAIQDCAKSADNDDDAAWPGKALLANIFDSGSNEIDLTITVGTGANQTNVISADVVKKFAD